jgi:superfamily II DNA or RNA helicase
MRKKELDAISARLAAIPADEARVILATGRYVGEGFDDVRLDTLFLTLPVSWHGTIAQHVGRLHRLYNGKREVRVYDYADLNVPMLARMFDRRGRGYETLQDTACGQRRARLACGRATSHRSRMEEPIRRQRTPLGRDGVDSSLADLFVDVALMPAPNAEGVNRARSASEAFAPTPTTAVYP